MGAGIWKRRRVGFVCHPDSGGTFSYTREIFGHDHGFLSAWFLSLTYIAIMWANVTALALIFRNMFGTVLQFRLQTEELVSAAENTAKELAENAPKTVDFAARRLLLVDDVQKATEAGMNAHVAKPIGVDNLAKTLSEFL